MPFVDIATGRIVGCKKHSSVWWHEKGHIEYNKSEKGIRNSYLEVYSLGITVIFLVLDNLFTIPFLKYFAAASLFLMVFYHLYEEAWCWIYSIKRRSKWLR